MRGLLATSIVLAGLAGSVFGHRQSANDDGPVRRRKTLGFGPVHPHAVFHTNPHDFTSNGFARSDTDPLLVAQRFVDHLLRDQSSDGKSYYIRDDSYTDRNTGVTHVFVRQLVHGIEVTDGDMNFNVKDGVVLSYGNSFYSGPAPTALFDPEASSPNVHSEFCGKLETELRERQNKLAQYLSSSQVVMGPPSVEAIKEKVLGPVEHLYDSNCAHVDLPLAFAANEASHVAMDPRKPLLQFMIAATPNADVVQDILAKYDEHLDNMSSTFKHHFVAGRETMVEHITNVPDAVGAVKASFAYIQVPEGSTTVLTPVWKYEVEMQDNWYEAAVSASSPHRIISVVDWASDSPIPTPKPSRTSATYEVFKWGVNDPEVGHNNRTLEPEHFDRLASPMGWHSLPFKNDPQSDFIQPSKEFWRNTTTTWGNNIFSHENWEGRNSWVSNGRPEADEHLKFSYEYNPQLTDSEDAVAEAKKYINATITQLFYTSNMVHDLYYRYGFDEVSGNFQQYNFGRGGKENDAVITNAQDGSGYNNANMMTPPDGQNGRCRMYIWNTAMPYRDGDLEAGIVIHELSHGLSTRLTGGPANSGCLGWGESGGMGEGWGDFLATTIRRKNATSTDYSMGAWAANRDTGIRNYPYSLDKTINPSTYKTLDKPGYWGVHAIGEVWAEILWVVEQKLVKKHGFVDSLFPPAPLEDGTIPEGDFYRPAVYNFFGEKQPLIPKHGNSLLVQLVINGMKLQKCRPSFFDARDAIIQADKILTDGENFCELWEGFAERGLGPDATIVGSTPWGGGVRTDDFDTHKKCL